MIEGKYRFAFSVLLMSLCIFSVFVPIVTARDAFAPSWLKEGVYVKYVGSEGEAGVFDVTDSRFEGINYIQRSQQFDTVYYSKVIFMWKCVSVNATMAKIQITFDCIDDSDYVLSRSGDVFVDLYTRAVYNVEGVFLGTTHLWAPADPRDGQEITVWASDFETITIPASINDMTWTTTIQGKQDCFWVLGENLTINGQPNIRLSIVYDLNTGLGVESAFSWDPLLAAVGVSTCVFTRSIDNPSVFSDTNIDLGPARSVINWQQMLPYVALVSAIILVAVALIVKRMRKKN
ncbi:MAG: hypothetical protein LBI79_04910 [Nitrososphaerota archaeon]|jgi:hypothetical protein|nr:hypothetical protein [Nitrososphaerota archaeon]